MSERAGKEEARTRADSDHANEHMSPASVRALEPFITNAKSPDDIAKLMLEIFVRSSGSNFGKDPISEIMRLTQQMRGNAWATAAYSTFMWDASRLDAERHGTTPKRPAPHLHGAPIDIDYIGNGDDHVMRVERALTFGEVIGGSVQEMVDVILERAQARPIRKLTITGHGSPGRQGVQDAEGGLHLDMRAVDRDQLRRLRGHFAPDAIVVLHGCNVGAGPKGEALLLMLSELWGGVSVRAGTAYQRLFGGNEGSTTTVHRDDKGRMQTDRHDNPRNEIAQSGPHTDARDARGTMKQWTDKDLAGMSLADRYRTARSLMTASNVKEMFTGGTSSEEANGVMRLFRTASPQDRRELYLYLENHPWTGDFHHGVLQDDDMLWNALSNAQLTELKTLLDG
ncbi:MAG TPA: DUF4347 domain-containing protein [Kofleriaceae bacterium]|nr:DUF4347 domain-containing protein [Kofleriaceae bacterium]